MFLKRFTIRNQLVLVIIIGAIISLPTMAYVMIRMHSNFAESQFILRHDRLTTLMASEMSPALHLSDGRIIGNGKKGPLTEKLQKEYFDCVAGKIKKYQNWLNHVV